MQVLEEIPSQLAPQVSAAVDWINRQRSLPFEVTGLVDYEQAVAAERGQNIQLGARPLRRRDMHARTGSDRTLEGRLSV